MAALDEVYTEDGAIFMPDERVTPKSTDKVVPLRGYAFVAAVLREGTCIGWTKVAVPRRIG